MEAARKKGTERGMGCHLPQAWLPGQEVCQRCVEVRKAAANVSRTVTSWPSLGSRSCFAEDSRFEACNSLIQERPGYQPPPKVGILHQCCLFQSTADNKK